MLASTAQPYLKLQAYCHLLRLHKPIGIFLLLWPTLWSLWLAARGLPAQKILWIFIVGVIVMRSAGCAINDFADRHFDGKVARTRLRPLASGLLRPREALIIFAASGLIAFFLVLQLNRPTIYLACVAMAVAMLYPFTKRITHFPQIILGIAFSMGIPMAYTALNVPLSLNTLLLFLIGILWSISYDTYYALADYDDDKTLPIGSTALFFAEKSQLFIAALQISVFSLLIWLGIRNHFGSIYYVALLVVCGLWLWEHWHCRNKLSAHYFQAFLHNNWVGLTIFIGIVGSV